jgi:hypothetical protein
MGIRIIQMFRQNHFHPIVIRKSLMTAFRWRKPSLINEFIRENDLIHRQLVQTAASEIPVVSVLFKEA